MIHTGACVGAGVSQGKSSSMEFDVSFQRFQEFRNDREKRVNTPTKIPDIASHLFYCFAYWRIWVSRWCTVRSWDLRGCALFRGLGPSTWAHIR